MKLTNIYAKLGLSIADGERSGLLEQVRMSADQRRFLATMNRNKPSDGCSMCQSPDLILWFNEGTQIYHWLCQKCAENVMKIPTPQQKRQERRLAARKGMREARAADPEVPQDQAEKVAQVEAIKARSDRRIAEKGDE